MIWNAQAPTVAEADCKADGDDLGATSVDDSTTPCTFSAGLLCIACWKQFSKQKGIQNGKQLILQISMGPKHHMKPAATEPLLKQNQLPLALIRLALAPPQNWQPTLRFWRVMAPYQFYKCGSKKSSSGSNRSNSELCNEQIP